MLTDIEIAKQAKLLPIDEVAGRFGLLKEELEPYGRYKAKLTEAAAAAISPWGWPPFWQRNIILWYTRSMTEPATPWSGLEV